MNFISYNEAKPFLRDTMIIHVVAQGETVASIAEYYNLSVERLALENGISTTEYLAIGETLVILIPEIVYTVQEGDTLNRIATSYNISIMELIRNNPYISERRYIYPGEQLVIKYEGDKIATLSTNGYVYPFVNIDYLKKVLPFLTYLTVYAYYYTATGEVIDINDAEIISTAREYGVAPVMVLTGLVASSEEQIERIHNILTDQNLQDYLINNLISVLDSKDYYGVNITTPYIQPEDRHLYVDFIRKFSARLKAEGYRPFLTLTRSGFELLTNVSYDDMQYDILGDLVDEVIIITYEWGFSYGLPPSIVSFGTIGNVVEYALSLIDPDKLNLGYSTIGYVWKLPYIDGVTVAQAITYTSANDLAREFDAVIHYDEITKSSYFQYYSDSEYIVRFREARGINEIVKMVPMFGVEGVAIWNVMYFFNEMWLVINSQYDIRKVIPVKALETDETDS